MKVLYGSISYTLAFIFVTKKTPINSIIIKLNINLHLNLLYIFEPSTIIYGIKNLVTLLSNANLCPTKSNAIANTEPTIEIMIIVL